jgi:hypothetical protein
MAARWGLSLRRRETVSLRARILWHWVKALLVAVGVSAVPGLLLLCGTDTPLTGPDCAPLALIPAGIAAVTGLVFVPAMYLLTARRIERERAVIG